MAFNFKHLHNQDSHLLDDITPQQAAAMLLQIDKDKQYIDMEEEILWLAEDDNAYYVIEDMGIEQYSKIMLEYIGDGLEQALIDVITCYSDSLEILDSDCDSNGEFTLAIALEYFGLTDNDNQAKDKLKMYALCTLLMSLDCYYYIMLAGGIDYEYERGDWDVGLRSGFVYNGCSCDSICLVKYPVEPEKQKKLLTSYRINDLILDLSNNDAVRKLLTPVMEEHAEYVDLEKTIAFDDGPDEDYYGEY